ncbi:hypothetical protein [Iodobacter fluviatilis]|uniref:Uncharacterized protein n=1 Tax=Iodobacter fluviatilis TaxID=537 RepID=A0A377Q2Y8_9NEIS|nr:hypothetical protein [Iodobacter fluviatilis]TCU90537.1 hypothetical protein EV682_101571 [Iodobacter fluviatilis]STQ89564.1 Uncharacterised protein [Iodobacter fluviatilis]
MPLTPKQEEQLCELLSAFEQQMLANIDSTVISSCAAINNAALLAGLQISTEHIIDPQYLYAILHQHCFAQLHQGDAQIAHAIADNQNSLVIQLAEK